MTIENFEQPADGLKGYSVVYFGNDWRGENRTSSHHVAMRLSQHVPLLYIESPGMRSPNLSGRDIGKAFRKIAAMFRLPRQIGPQLWLCSVPQIPFRRLRAVRWLNRVLSRWMVRRYMRHLGFRRTISWFVVPHTGFLAGRIGEQFAVYYCIDDYSAHPGVDVTAIQAMDDALSASVDRLFVAPPSLMAAKMALNRSALPAPHGVDTVHFGRVHDGSATPPDGAPALNHPVVGYFGSIAAWTDVQLLAELARQRPQYTLLLVGFVSTDISDLQGLKNVVFAGAVSYEALPRWATLFDVCVLPYRKNRQVLNSNPLKLREYLATGKPVVSIRAPAVEEFADVVSIVDTPEQFIAAIDRELADDNAQAQARRVRSVADQSWDARVSKVIDIVTADLAARSAGAGR